MSVALQFKLTQTGQAAVWNATNTGTQLNLTHIQFGSGNRAPNGTETALLSPQQSAAIAAGFAVSATQIRMSAIFGGTQSYVIREVGVWAGDPAVVGSKLVGYWSQAAGDLATKSPGVDFIFSHDMTLDAAVPAGSLTILADNAQSAMLAMITAHEAKADPHPQYATEWIHSPRDFVDGTLITTGIDYSVTTGAPFVLEIRGNSFGHLTPFEIQYQGYIYSNTIINHGGYSTGTNITGLVALNVGGLLCFWFPRQAYWHGYNVRVYAASAGRAVSRVNSIVNAVKPVGTKEVGLSANIRQVLRSDNFNAYAPSLTGAGASGTWPISVSGNGVPVGCVGHFASAAVPAGWLKANGAAVSRTTYAALFAAISTTFGAGDGATTFNLPDLRGEFVRGWDDGRGVDAGRTFGSKQLASLVIADVGGATENTIEAIQGASIAHLNMDTKTAEYDVGGANYKWFAAETTLIAANPSTTSMAVPSALPELQPVRPRNVALLACIKF